MLSSRSLKLIVTVAALMAGGCDSQGDAPAQPKADPSAAASAELPAGQVDRSHKGEAIPAMVVKDASGKELNLASLKGKPLLVNLWATWCGPCVVELPTLEAVAKTGKIQVIAVSQDMGKPEDVAPFLKAKGAPNLAPWLDPENDLAFHYGASTLPTTVLYGSDGKEVWRYSGGLEWTGEEGQKLLGEGCSQNP